MRNSKIIILSILISIFSMDSYAASRLGRLGIGMSNQVATGIDTISLKLQRSRSMAIGGLIGLDSNSDASKYALGLKVYRNIYEEPQLTFYSAFTGIMFTYFDETADKTNNGYQVEGAFGSEFSFQGLESLGFSFEFGLGLVNNDNKTTLQTMGHSVIKSAIHFYL